MLTLQEIQPLVTRYLNSEDFKVTEHEIYCDTSTHSSIKVKILTGNAQREWKNKNPYLDVELTPTYFIKENVMIVEDLSEKGFSWANQPETLDLQHVKLALETLARYHAQKMDSKAEKAKELENLQKPEMDCQTFNNCGFEALTAVSDLFPEESVREDLNKTIKNSLEFIKGKFCKVLCHGYMCGDAVLFRYSKKVPVECKFLNFTAQQYAPPGYDVLHFIYMSTNVEFRKNHLHELLKFYYECLKAELHKRNLDADKTLPLEEDFELSIHSLLPLIKTQLARLCHIRCSKPKVCQKFSEDDPVLSTEENFGKMLTEAVKELKDLVTSPGLTLEDCFQIIKNKIGTTNYELINYELVPLEKVSGFFGDHKKLKISIRVDNEIQTLNFFVKFTPQGKAQKSIADDCGSFYKENFFYRHFVPKAQEVGATIINDCTVPCYFTRLDEVMVFEDFGIRNYGTLNPRQPLNYEEVEIIVKQMAKFHASSIILEEKLTEQTRSKYCLKEHYEKGLQESFFTKIPNHQGARSMDMSVEVMQDQIGLFPDPNSAITDEDFKKKIGEIYERVYELVRPSKEFRNVVCHGDLWVSNILINKINGKPVDCRFVDFQIMRYCPPAHDLLGFIHLTTNRSFRKAHMDDIIDLYHGELSKALETCGCDVEKIYPYENFRKSVEYMRPQAVCQTCIYYHICVGNPDLLKDYMETEEKIKQLFLDDRRDFIVEMCERDPLYKERNKEAMQDLREYCEKYF